MAVKKAATTVARVQQNLRTPPPPPMRSNPPIAAQPVRRAAPAPVVARPAPAPIQRAPAPVVPPRAQPVARPQPQPVARPQPRTVTPPPPPRPQPVARPQPQPRPPVSTPRPAPTPAPIQRPPAQVAPPPASIVPPYQPPPPPSFAPPPPSSGSGYKFRQNIDIGAAPSFYIDAAGNPVTDAMIEAGQDPYGPNGQRTYKNPIQMGYQYNPAYREWSQRNDAEMAARRQDQDAFMKYYAQQKGAGDDYWSHGFDWDAGQSYGRGGELIAGGRILQQDPNNRQVMIDMRTGERVYNAAPISFIGGTQYDWKTLAPGETPPERQFDAPWLPPAMDMEGITGTERAARRLANPQLYGGQPGQTPPIMSMQPVAQTPDYFARLQQSQYQTPPMSGPQVQPPQFTAQAAPDPLASQMSQYLGIAQNFNK